MDSGIDEQPVLTKQSAEIIWKLLNSDLRVEIKDAEVVAKAKTEFWKLHIKGLNDNDSV